MNELLRIVVTPRKLFGRVDYHAVNSTAMLFSHGKNHIIPAKKMDELRAAGYSVEEIK